MSFGAFSAIFVGERSRQAGAFSGFLGMLPQASLTVGADGQKEQEDHVYPMDMNLALQIYNYYMLREPLMRVCKKVLYAMIFNGGGFISLNLRSEDEEGAPEELLHSGKNVVVREEDEGNADVGALEGGPAPQEPAGAAAASKKPNTRSGKAPSGGAQKKTEEEAPPKGSAAVSNVNKNVTSVRDTLKKGDEVAQAKKERDEEGSFVLNAAVADEFFRLAETALDYKKMFGMVPIRINYRELLRRFGPSGVGETGGIGSDEEKKKAKNAGAAESSSDSSDDEDSSANDSGLAPAGRHPKRAKKSSEDKEGAPDTLPQGAAPEPLVEIPAFGTGIFALQFPQNRRNPRLVFVENSPKTQGSSPEISKDVVIFVWPGHEPPISTASFVSDAGALFERYLEVEALKGNRLVSDSASSRPPVFVSRGTDNRKPEEMTQEELLGETRIEGETPLEARRTRSVVMDRARLNVMQNGTARSEAQYQQAYMPGGPFGAGGAAATATYGAASGMSYVPLPEGMVIQKHTVPVSLGAALEDVRASYEDMVCLMMGVPRSFFDGKSSAASGGKSGGAASAAKDHEAMRITVDSNRKAVSEFIQFLYEQLFRAGDNEWLAEVLYSARVNKKKRISADLSKSTRGRIQHSKPKKAGSSSLAVKEVEKFFSEHSRVSVRFHKDPLPLMFAAEELILCANQGVLSPMEMVNKLRPRFDAEPIRDPNHPLILAARMQREQLWSQQTLVGDEAQSGVDTQRAGQTLSAKQTEVADAQKGLIKKQQVTETANAAATAAAAAAGPSGGSKNKKKK